MRPKTPSQTTAKRICSTGKGLGQSRCQARWRSNRQTSWPDDDRQDRGSPPSDSESVATSALRSNAAAETGRGASAYMPRSIRHGRRVSRHLAYLRRTGWFQARREGFSMHYRRPALPERSDFGCPRCVAAKSRPRLAVVRRGDLPSTLTPPVLNGFTEMRVIYLGANRRDAWGSESCADHRRPRI